MKKIISLSVLFLFFGLAPIALAQGFVPLAPIPGLTEGVTANTEGLAKFFNNLYKYLIGLAAVLAVIEIIWGGLEISTKDSVSKQSDGKERITQAIFGLILVLSPVLVFSIINPSILNLSLNLPELDTKSGPPVQTSTTLPTCNSFRTTNCTPADPTTAPGSIIAPPTPTPGMWCFERKQPGGAANNFLCASSQATCVQYYNYDSANRTFSAVSTCYLR